MLHVKPRLSDLYAVVEKVSEYPITSEEIVELALEENASSAVIEFYRAFPSDEVFTDEEELIARTEQVALMHEQGKDQPFEQWVASEED